MNIRSFLKKYLYFFIGLVGILFIGFFFFIRIQSPQIVKEDTTIPIAQDKEEIQPLLTPLPTVPVTKILPTTYHVFQSFNNCGPASLSMALAFYGISVSQQELGEALRPYQVANGDNDDKSVTLAELADKAKEYGFMPYHRPNGSIEIMKQFIAQDIPVITRTWLHKDDDIGHFRVVKGYDETTKQIIQDDSFQNKNLWYSYTDFTDIWKKFNYEYLVLIPKEKEVIAKQILAENYDEQRSWKHAVSAIKKEIENDPTDIYNHFNLSVAYYHTKEYAASVREYELVADQLPFRTLWYQIEPIKAYYELGNYEKVFSITTRILDNQNRAFSELYILRGDSYKKLGNNQAAKDAYEQAVYYNKNLPEAKAAVASITL